MAYDEYDAPVYEDDSYEEEGDFYSFSTVISILDQIENMVGSAKSFMFTSNVTVNKVELLDLLGQIRLSLPEDMKEADRVLSQMDELIAQADEQKESTEAEAIARAEAIITEAEAKATALKERSRKEAEELRTRAEEESNRLREETQQQVQEMLSQAHAETDRLVSQEHVYQEAERRAEEIVTVARNHAIDLTDKADAYCENTLDDMLRELDSIYQQVLNGQNTLIERRQERRGE
ncbi:hypothetical protein NXS08_03300 [Gleimia sp. 6138-11-ORH1]|uniref:hypothetical protein n=1 Tax=Gleimia sp. 6138-11-ORH1 TaxID=2973937 RepID=UPI0021674307|nr:hypothetical protein [Gleimia sp. 6138-11-ORH1]MCS4484512.1 hypothetical protein [Gleimia sp. 6138-11-ORH1]